MVLALLEALDLVQEVQLGLEDLLRWRPVVPAHSAGTGTVVVQSGWRPASQLAHALEVAEVVQELRLVILGLQLPELSRHLLHFAFNPEQLLLEEG